MRLKTVHITKFRSIKNSQPFTVDANVTCLVGKNESGKTAILQALEKINPVDRDKNSFKRPGLPSR